MSWMNPFKRRSPNTITVWDYTFDLTDEHPTEESMHPLKFTYDTLGEDCFNRLNEISPPTNGQLPRRDSQRTWTQDVKKDEEKSHRDLFTLLEENQASDPTLHKLWDQVNTVPEWVDWDQIARGQEVFYRYGSANLTGLTYQSLLGGMGAQRVVETLARTGGFSVKVARRRLYETTQHVLQVTKSLESIQPGGEGWASTIRVRLLHAAVRDRIMKMARSRPSYYNVEEWGIPINDLDCIGTIGTFSSTLIWLALPRQGIFLRSQEIKDYIALWRYIAIIIGCPAEPDVFANPSTAKKWIEALLYHEIHPSEMSGLLANNIIKCLERRPPLYISREMMVASARWLNGNSLCDALGLEPATNYHRFLMAGQCVFYTCMAYSHRYIPSLDKKKIAFVRRACWVMIVEHKTGLEGKVTDFGFKYVPEYGTLTTLEEHEEGQELNHTIERRNLRWMAFGVVGMVGFTVVGAYIGLKATGMLFGLVHKILV